MSKFKFNISDNMGFEDHTEWVSDMKWPKSRKVFLFMIGGSGASIIEPILYYFFSRVAEAKYKIIPVYVDRNFHSEIVSRSISSIKDYQTYCAFTASNSVVMNPYFFIDNDSMFNGDNNLSMILDKITSDDTVVFSYSLYNKQNLKTRDLLVGFIRRNISARIFNMVFLPYFRLNFGDENFLAPEDYVKYNLRSSTDLLPDEYVFYAGLSKPSSYINSDYQRNPFNVVSLILSYALITFIEKENEEIGSYNYFNLEMKPKYNFNDLFPGSELRKIVLNSDFRMICWNLIFQTKGFRIFNFNLDPEIIKSIDSYYSHASYLIKELGDMTIYQEMQIYLRKQKDYNFDSIWKEFFRYDFYFVKSRHSRNSFLNEVLSYVDVDVMNTSNMVIHEIIKSIDQYFKIHWQEIEKLYY